MDVVAVDAVAEEWVESELREQWANAVPRKLSLDDGQVVGLCSGFRAYASVVDDSRGELEGLGVLVSGLGVRG
ncbi:hypothetical protein GCM10023195_14780 [Actinoallomurus liliacearum]|uniref:Uncharacterized protein n=1 Tax=Actinoallomurus liliacearum TaxID=1080073 RepID=A0ABP8TES7_9ACTN